jgi:hypothetical protein
MSEPTDKAAEESQPTPERNPRLAQMQQIAQQRQEEIAPELNSFNEDTGEIYQNQAQQPAETPEQKTVRLKVDGQEQEVPAEKVYEAGIRALQKESAADKRLQEAAELRRQYEQMIFQALSSEPEPPQQPQGAQIDDLVETIKNAPFDEKAAARLAEALRQPRFNPQEVVEPILNVVQRKLEGRDALAEFRSKHSDLMSDPNAMETFHLIERGMVATGDRRPYLERWSEIAERVKSARVGTVDMQDRQVRKEGIVNVPSAGARAPVKDEPKPKTVRDIVTDMAKARHQRLE